jgi:hypothetical protein
MPYYLHYEWQDKNTGDDVFWDAKFSNLDEYSIVKQLIENAVTEEEAQQLLDLYENYGLDDKRR